MYFPWHLTLIRFLILSFPLFLSFSLLVMMMRCPVPGQPAPFLPAWLEHLCRQIVVQGMGTGWSCCLSCRKMRHQHHSKKVLSLEILKAPSCLKRKEEIIRGRLRSALQKFFITGSWLLSCGNKTNYVDSTHHLSFIV